MYRGGENLVHVVLWMIVVMISFIYCADSVPGLASVKCFTCILSYFDSVSTIIIPA